MRIQNTEIGSARKIIARLHPMPDAINPNVNDPHMAPIELIAAIHETSVGVNGPVTSGVCDEDSFALANPNHPRVVPEGEFVRLLIDRFVYIPYSRTHQLCSNHLRASTDFLKEISFIKIKSNHEKKTKKKHKHESQGEKIPAIAA